MAYTPPYIRPYSRFGDLRWCVTTLSGQRLPYGQNRVSALTSLLYEAGKIFGEGAVNYDKVYRGLRKSDAYAQVITLPPSLGFTEPQLVVLTIAPAVER